MEGVNSDDLDSFRQEWIREAANKRRLEGPPLPLLNASPTSPTRAIASASNLKEVSNSFDGLTLEGDAGGQTITSIGESTPTTAMGWYELAGKLISLRPSKSHWTDFLCTC